MRDAPGTLRLDPRWVSAVTEEAPAPRGRRAEPWSGSELVVWRVSRRLGTPPPSSWPGCRSCGVPEVRRESEYLLFRRRGDREVSVELPVQLL